jgi:hypothetical protein
VSRLRWILHQQKENFLPLKVIKERLEQLRAGERSAPVSSIAPRPATGIGQRRRSRRTPPDPSVAPPLPFDPPALDREPVSRPRSPTPEPAPAPERVAARASAPASAPPVAAEKRGLTRRELARAVGLEEAQVAELESFGLITPVDDTGDDALFGEEAQAIAEATAGVYARGIDARHLRMYKQFAQREAGLFEQVSMHYLRQRNPEARAKAKEELAALSRLGRALRGALLVQAIRSSLAE